jgi:hypothetical protein
MFETG